MAAATLGGTRPVQAPLYDNNTKGHVARRSIRRSLSVSTLLLLWLAVPLAAAVTEKALTGG
jgi:hypothetical protein